MEYRKFNDTYVVRLQRGEEILTSLAELVKKENIPLATVEGIGASDHVVMGLYDLNEKLYHKTELNIPLEITSLLGNITTKDGEPYFHLHITVCDENTMAHGGHLNECRISVTGEIFVRCIEGNVERLMDGETGINLFRFL